MVLAVAVRYGLGLMFLVAAAGKVSPRAARSFCAAVEGLLGVRQSMLAHCLLVATIIVEMLVATGLLVGISPGTEFWLICATALLTLFTGLTSVALARGKLVSCACFGALSDEPIRVRLIARNGIIATAAVIAVGIEEKLSVFLLAIAVAALGLLLTQTILIVQLSRRMTSRAAPPGIAFEPPFTGVLVPPIPTSDGTYTADVILAFFSPSCDSCVDAVPELATTATRTGRKPIASLSSNGATSRDTKEFAEILTSNGVLIADDADELINLLNVRIFPSFALVDDSGRVVASCNGPDRLRSIVGSEEHL